MHFSGFSKYILKDAFFCIHPDSQYCFTFFVFEWSGSDTLEATQYAWIVLPQNFGESPHLFRNALSRETRDLNLEKGTLLTVRL